MKNYFLAISLLFYSISIIAQPVWKEYGPMLVPKKSGSVFSNGIGRVTFIRLHPDYDGIYNKTFFVGAFGGLWKTPDEGETWENCNTDNLLMLAVSDLAIDPVNPNIMYLATGDFDRVFKRHLKYYNEEHSQSIGIYKSTDGGNTWGDEPYGVWNGDESFWSTPSLKKISRILIDPDDNNKLYCALIQYVPYVKNGEKLFSNDGYIYKSDNYGLTWNSIFYANNGYFRSMEFAPNDPDVIYVSGQKTFIVKHSGTIVIDAGTAGLPDSTVRTVIAVTPGQDSWVWALTNEIEDNSSNIFNLYKSTDYGNSFQIVGDDLYFSGNEKPEHRFCLASLKIDINTVEVSLGSYMVKTSINNGLNFNKFPNTHCDIHALLYTPTGDLLIGCDGGLYRYNSASNICIDISDSLSIAQVYGVDSYSDEEGENERIVIGTQDCSSMIYDLNLYPNNEWGCEDDGDGNRCQISKNNKDIAYISYGYSSAGYIHRSSFITNSETALDFTTIYVPWESGESHNYNFPLKLEPTSDNLIYTGGTNIYKKDCSNTSNQWQPVGNFHSLFNIPYGDAHELSSIAICPYNPSYIYAGYFTYLWGDFQYEKSIFRTCDGGATWNTIANGLYTPLAHSNLSYLMVDPKVPNTAFVTFQNIDGEDYNKVFRGNPENNSYTWNDISEGLPKDAAANCIATDSSLNGSLYLGTHQGIYYRNENMNQWIKFSEGLPNIPVWDISYNFNENALYAGTIGRGVWKCKLCWLEETQFIVDENLTFNTKKNVHQNIIINPEKTLTINNDMTFADNASITVKKGASLIIDGCKLTSRCGFWQGIVVEGDPNELQSTQGYVELKNGAIIENAVTGISSPNGGVVKVDNSTFHNCITGIEILNYPDHINYGEIILNTFTTDDSWIDDYYDPLQFIKLSNVHAVKIWGNTFQNLRPVEDSDYLGRGIGIRCRDANCTVYSYSSQQTNVFSGLRYGIHATSTIVTNNLMIDDAEFENNLRGIYLSCMDLARVNRNTFTVPTASKDYDCIDTICYGHSYGLTLDHCSDYEVEENHFNSEESMLNNIGLIVSNSGTEPNLIYKNYFNELRFGAIAQYNNRAYEETGHAFPGLEFRCNEFTDCSEYDIAIAGANGIGEFQGNTDISTGNIFNQCGNFGFVDLYNGSGAERIFYFYKYYPPVCYINESTIYLYSSDDENTCSSHFGEHNPEQKKSQMAVQTDSINYLINEIEYVEDGGNTQELVDEVNETMPSEALDLKDELIDRSPYLSDSVLVTTVINESVLPAVMLRDVLVANPQSAKSDTVSKSLDERNNPLPGYMREQIDEGRYVLSPLEVMEIKLDNHQKTKTRLLNEILDYYLNDTLPGSTDSIEAVLDRETSYESKLLLASWYLGRNEFADLLQLLNDIPSICQMNVAQQTDFDKMKALMLVQAELMQDSLSYFEMDSIQEQTIRELAEDEKYRAGALARNIVYLIDSVNYEEPVIMPNPENQNKSAAFYKPIEGIAKIEVFPNPAAKFFIIDYCISDDIFEKGGYVSITDASGRNIIHQELAQKENQLLFETVNLSSGTFYCNLYSGNILVASRKFLVIK